MSDLIIESNKIELPHDSQIKNIEVTDSHFDGQKLTLKCDIAHNADNNEVEGCNKTPKNVARASVAVTIN